MEHLYGKIHEYLKMDEEISFGEFDQFYKQVLKYFSEKAENLAEEDVWKGLFIIENIMSNAENRIKEEKGAKQKKYKKMKERASLWAQNFAGKLYKLGYTEDQLNEKFEEMFHDFENLKD